MAMEVDSLTDEGHHGLHLRPLAVRLLVGRVPATTRTTSDNNNLFESPFT